MKAEEAVGFCREAATDHSPGLQPWVTRTQKHALKVASEVLGWCQRGSTIEDCDIRPTDRINTPSPEQTPRPPLSGRLICLHHPGLKPWAMVYNRFAVNPTGSRAKTRRAGRESRHLVKKF
jgi:hypothetical protein